jgi:hypothetical protein
VFVLALSPGDAGGVAGAVIALIALLVSTALSRRGRVRKELRYRLSVARVASIRREAGKRVTVLYEGRPVGDVRVVTLRVECAGNHEISASDVERPLAVPIGPAAQLLSWEIAEATPPEIRPRAALRDGRLEIDPLLLNTGDSFALTALVSGYAGTQELDGRIAGVRSFTEAYDDREPLIPISRVGPVLLSAIAIIVLAAGTATFVDSFLLSRNQPTSPRSETNSGTTVFLSSNAIVLRGDGGLCSKTYRAPLKVVRVQLRADGQVRVMTDQRDLFMSGISSTSMPCVFGGAGTMSPVSG